MRCGRVQHAHGGHERVHSVRSGRVRRSLRRDYSLCAVRYWRLHGRLWRLGVHGVPVWQVHTGAWRQHERHLYHVHCRRVPGRGRVHPVPHRHLQRRARCFHVSGVHWLRCGVVQRCHRGHCDFVCRLRGVHGRQVQRFGRRHQLARVRKLCGWALQRSGLPLVYRVHRGCVQHHYCRISLHRVRGGQVQRRSLCLHAVSVHCLWHRQVLECGRRGDQLGVYRMCARPLQLAASYYRVHLMHPGFLHHLEWGDCLHSLRGRYVQCGRG